MPFEFNLEELAHDLKLCRCQASYGTDKGYIHSYLANFYQPLLESRNYIVSILEIGIFKGSSLVLWNKALPNTLLAGVDIEDQLGLNPEFKLLRGGHKFSLRYGDAYSGDDIFTGLGKFDLIIDDGPHTFKSQLHAIEFRRILNPKGIMIIEDVPNLHYRLGRIKYSIPKQERKFLFGIGYVHLSGRYDDALIIYSRDPDFKVWFRENSTWISRNVLLQSYFMASLPPIRSFFRLISISKRRKFHNSKRVIPDLI